MTTFTLINTAGDKFICLIDAEDSHILDTFKLALTLKSKHKYYIHGYPKDLGSRHRKLLHRHLLNVPTGSTVDHINGNSLDNRRENIRICNAKLNHLNKGLKLNKVTSTYKGVDWVKKDRKWRTRVNKFGKCVHCSYHINEVDAARAYNKNAELHHGEYASLNKI